MRITKLQISNFLGLRFLQIGKLGKLIKIEGENGVGKSSVLKGILETFKGSGVKPTLIHSDADQSDLKVELDNRIVVHRRLTATSNDVTVKIDGATQKRPASYLAELMGSLLNPVAFFESKPSEQRDMILAALDCRITPDWLASILPCNTKFNIGAVDYNEHGLTILEGLRSEAYSRRRSINSVVTQLEKSIEQDRADLPDGVDPKRWDDYDLDVQLTKVSEMQKARSEQEHRIGDRENLRRDYAKMQAEISRLRLECEKNVEEGKSVTATIDAYKEPDVETHNTEILAYKEYLKHAASLEGIDRKQTELDEARAEHAALDEAHTLFKDTLPQELIAKADLPVDNLEISADGISVGGTPLEQLSTAERIVFSTTLARELSGDLNVICIDGWESIRGETRKQFVAAMEDDNFEYFIAEATDNPKLQITGAEKTTKRPENAS